MKKVIIYTDGACSGNPGPGGWGAVLIFGEIEKKISGGEKNTTNNRMEIAGVIEGLKLLKEPCEVELFSDSKYVCDGISKWLDSWKKNNWKNSAKQPVKNQDLWEEILKLKNIHKISVNWVKGHSNDKYNEIADSLATAAVNRG